MRSIHRESDLVLVLDAHGRLEARSIHWPDRIRARLLATHLDRQLAAGRSPDSSAALALRARTLLSPRMRSSVAQAFERLAAPWIDGQPRSYFAFPSPSLSGARSDLAALAARLSSGPVAVKGLARAHLLLSDGAGPLYGRGAEEALHVASREILEALDPLTP